MAVILDDTGRDDTISHRTLGRKRGERRERGERRGENARTRRDRLPLVSPSPLFSFILFFQTSSLSDLNAY
jgi:hypothetical protein